MQVPPFSDSLPSDGNDPDKYPFRRYEHRSCLLESQICLRLYSSFAIDARMSVMSLIHTMLAKMKRQVSFKHLTSLVWLEEM